MTQQSAPPFSGALDLDAAGDGHYRARLGEVWTIGPKAHGGLLLAVLVRAALARLAEVAPEAGPDPLAISADFLRAPGPGQVDLHADVVKHGRTVSVVGVRMEQGGVPVLTATVTAGLLTDEAPLWSDLPDQPAEPPAGALSAGAQPGATGLATACDLRWDPASTPFLRGEQGPPVVRGWVRPHGEEPDLLFALLAGDVLPPVVFNTTGRFGWAPTVQLTALLRARPAPGWLRVESRATVIGDRWFDEDATVVDAAGRLVCQSRQLALAPMAAG